MASLVIITQRSGSGVRVDRSRRGPLIRWAHQRQENLIDNLLDSFVRQGLEGHQDLMACKVRRKRHNPRGEAGSGDLTTTNRSPPAGLHDVVVDDLPPQ